MLSRACLHLVPFALLAVACSGSSSSAGISPAERQAFSRATNLIPVDITVGGSTGTAYVDTGNPFTLLDPKTFSAAAGLAANGGNLSITVGAQTATGAFVLPTAAGLTSPDPAFPLGANVGFSAIGSFVAAFDYRDVAFHLGAATPPPPAGLEPEVVLDFSFEGGSTLDGIQVPRSRIVATVALEGTNYRMMIDTGASYVTLSQAAFSALTSDGRPQLSGGSTETTSGVSSSSLARAKSLVVGGVEVDSLVVAHDTSFDSNLSAISTDAGETIDGSLGGTFLHDFYVTVDYPAQKLHLARYSDVSFAIDPGERIGLDLAIEGASYVVGSVSGDAATKGISVGDVVEAIDGTALAGLPVSEVAVLLFGQVGATKQVKLETATQGATTVSLTVTEMLPTTASSSPVGASFRDGLVDRNFALRR